MKSGPQRVTKPRIEDVAARAGTSPITVSRVLREPERVAPATRERVTAAIAALGYIPNLAASGLASRRSGIVGLLVPTIDNTVFAATVQALGDTVATAGLQILLGDFRYSDEGERRLVRALVGRQPEALVVIGVVRDEALRAMLQQLAIPVIETWDLTRNPVDTVIGFSNRKAGAAMARHFLARGRRHFGFVGGRDDRAQARGAGFASVLREAGLPPPVVETVGGSAIAQGREGLDRILSTRPEADAVFFSTDMLAVGGLIECRHRGLAVPERIAIAGLGDQEIGRELAPTLTTVQVPAEGIGRRAGEIVLSRLRGEPVGKRVLDLGFSILERRSTER